VRVEKGEERAGTRQKVRDQVETGLVTAETKAQGHYTGRFTLC
jgi:hypothetical protein